MTKYLRNRAIRWAWLSTLAFATFLCREYTGPGNAQNHAADYQDASQNQIKHAEDLPQGHALQTVLRTGQDHPTAVSALVDIPHSILPAWRHAIPTSDHSIHWFPWHQQVPVKTAQPLPLVYVGGQSIGVRLQSDGVIVVGFQRLGGDNHSPAMDSNVRIGDVIDHVGDNRVRSVDDLRRLVNQASGESLSLSVRRGTEHQTLRVRPLRDLDGFRHLGLYVRDRTSGIGTLTFYDPAHHAFGALGHVITDVDTGEPIVGTGSLYPAEITGVTKGTVGRPGEKRGRFVGAQKQLGSIRENCPFGVFGSMNTVPGHLFQSRQMPVAAPSQVHDGDATILTVLHGQVVKAYKVEIEKLVDQKTPDTKSMVVHVVDPRLLSETGGIVQGMSGSPILQNGRLVGAVTHVFLSDVTRGYGVYAAWMLRESAHTGERTGVQTALKRTS